MASAFASKKAKILQSLSQPDAAYSDASPKGSVDEGIRGLVDEINQIDSFVTTSSCAGRIAVYLEGRRKGTNEIDSNVPSDGLGSGAGGKGGGRWLFVSHDPLEIALERTEKPTDWASLFGLSADEPPSAPSSTRDVRWVRCKFEPMILHIFCSSVDSAIKAQNAAMTSGFRESGISSISHCSDGSSNAMIAVRSAGLAFDSVIGYETPQGKLVPMVSEKYLDTLVKLANERFSMNKDRTGRFRKAFFDQIRGDSKSSQAGDEAWEPADVRKARKRAEGLALQASARNKNTQVQGSDSGTGDSTSAELGTMFQ